MLSYNHTLLPVAHTSTRHGAVCRLQAGARTQRTTARGADGGTGWRTGTGSCSVDILAGIRLRWYQLVEYCCRRSQGTGRSYHWALQGPVHQTRVAEEAGHLWRDATSSFATGATGQTSAGKEMPVNTATTDFLSRTVNMFSLRTFGGSVRNPLYIIRGGTLWVMLPPHHGFLSNFPCWTERLSSGKQRFDTSLKKPLSWGEDAFHSSLYFIWWQWRKKKLQDLLVVSHQSCGSADTQENQ